jgi:Mce-associated membrane protein
VRSDAPSGGATPPPDADGSGGTGALRRSGGSVGADAYVGDAGNLGADAYIDDEIEASAHADPARDAAPGRTVVIPRQRPRPHRRVRPAPGGAPDAATGSRPAVATGSRPAVGGTGRAKVGAAGAATAAARGSGGNEDAQPSPGTPAGPAPSRFRLLAGGLAVLLVAAFVAAGLFARGWYDQRQLDDARDGALAAARQATVNFVSISAATVDRDLKRISDGATGQFKDEFAQDTAQVRAAVMTNKVDSRGTILRAAVVSANLRSAVVLVAIDATVKNTSAPDGRLSHYRIQVNLSRGASGRWLVSQLQFVG